jgi:hypothetical protein
MFDPAMYMNFLGGGQGQQQGGGFFSNPMVQAMGLGFGGSLLGGLSSMLGGESPEEKRRKQMYQMGLAEMNSQRDIINPATYAQRSYNAALPMMNKQAGQIGERLNLDSGVAQGALGEMMIPQFQQDYSQGYMQNQLGKENRRRGMFSSMMGQY